MARLILFQIKFGLEKNGQEAAFIVFDGTESATLEDWFTAENIRKSSWPTLTPSTEFGKIGVQ